MTAPGLIVAAPRSGGGKTTLTLALLAALSRRGIVVQAAKVGPDYIDPSFHAAATGRPSFNLDSWAMPPSLIDALVAEHAAHADLLVIEGAMGLFDGVPAPPLGPARRPISPRGSACRCCWSSTSPGNRNRRRRWCAASPPTNATCGSAGWCSTASAASGMCGWWPTRSPPSTFPCSARIPRDASLALPERHLGLVQAGEHANLAARLEHLADMAEQHLDLDAIKQLAVPPHRSAARLDAPVPPPGQRIALAQDDGLQLRLSACAGRLAAARAPRSCPFSPLADEAPPEDCDSCWLPGGYPELHAGALAAADRFRAGLTQFRRDAAGAWRVRRLHGARREPRGRRRRQPPHGGAARPCHQLRAAQAASRLSPGAAPIRQSVGEAGDAPARARIPLCRLDVAGPGRAAGRACRQPGRKTRRGQADGGATSPAPSSTPSPRSKRPSPRPSPARRSPCRCGRRARRARSARRARRRSLRQAACRDRARDAGQAPEAGADVPPRPTGDRRAHGRARRRGAWPMAPRRPCRRSRRAASGCADAARRARRRGWRQARVRRTLRRCAADRRGCALCLARPASIAARLRSRPRWSTPVPWPAKRAPPPPNSAAAIAEAAVVLPMPISPSTTRSASGESASYPADTASRNSASSMAGCLVKSAVG